MTRQLLRRACIAVLPLSLWACAAPAPAPLESRHPANPAAIAAPMPTLQVLHTYQDFSAQSGGAAPDERREGQDDSAPSEGKSDDHVH